MTKIRRLCFALLLGATAALPSACVGGPEEETETSVDGLGECWGDDCQPPSEPPEQCWGGYCEPPSEGACNCPPDALDCGCVDVSR